VPLAALLLLAVEAIDGLANAARGEPGRGGVQVRAGLETGEVAAELVPDEFAQALPAQEGFRA
jgi:hypothetical protein